MWGGSLLAAAWLAAAPGPVPRIELNVHPAALSGLVLEAVETWTEPGHPEAADSETDRVEFYHGVPIEVQTSERGRELGPAAAARQRRAADRLRAKIARVCHDDSHDGRCLDLQGDIWTLPEFEGEFVWSGHTVAGRTELAFAPRPDLRPATRMQTILSHTAGQLEVDAASGQILGGSFHSLGPVNFGAGLLARIRSFTGTFEMQPVGVGERQAWVMRRITVTVDGRKLLRRIHGTETMVYSVLK